MVGPFKTPDDIIQRQKQRFLQQLERKGRGPLSALATRLPKLDSAAVFSNADTPLNRIDTYGFDYDYTLVMYNQNVHDLIYDEAKKYLIERKGYPSTILSDYKFDPSFAIRGTFA